MPEPKLNIPKFITPLSWIVVLMATIKDIDEFYNYNGLKSIIILIVGAGACFAFIKVLPQNTSLSNTKRQARRLYLLGFFASLLLLVLPSLFTLVYPKLIEQTILESKLNNYLETQEAPSFFISTSRTKVANSLINIDRKISDQTFDLAISLLQETDKNIEESDNLLLSFSSLLHAKLQIEKGNFDESLNLINKNLKNSENKVNNFWIRYNIINLYLKAKTLSHQAEGVESYNYLIIYDKAINEAKKIKDKKLIANLTLGKSSALYKIALSTKSDSIWNMWNDHSLSAIFLFHQLGISEELDAISNHLNGLRSQYTIIYDVDSNSVKLSQLLHKHDSIFAIGENLIATRTFDNLTSKLWTINSILFDYFTREPAISNNYDFAYKKLQDIEPQVDNEYYQFVAQWHQVKGLIQKKRGYDAESKNELIKALKIWHANKQLGKERELTNDLIDNVYTNFQTDKEDRIELLFRWGGLKLLQKNFDPETKNRNLLLNVINRFDKEGIINHKVADLTKEN